MAPKPVPVRPIKQGDLQQVLTARLVVETLEAQLATAKDELAKIELPLIHKIETGIATEPGDLACGVNVSVGARRPKWKEEAAASLGPEWVERVIARTEPGPPAKKLVILAGGKALKGGGS